MQKIALLFLLFVLLAACTPEESRERESNESIASERSRSEALSDARTQLDGQSYQDQHGDIDCTIDCSGHDAGYAWAQENEVEDTDDCGGKSDSFIEGCNAYVEDLNELAESE